MVLLIVSFIAGVLTVLAPCVLPLLPVILAGSVSETKNRRRPLIIIGALSVSVFAFTLLLKGSTALIGASPTFWNYISGAILLAFGLTLIFPETWARIVLKIPGHNRPDRWITKGYDGSGNFWTDIIVGAALGPVFTTCSPTFFVILATVLPQSLGMGLLD
jgi:cytochrome c-type biogenesis protein